MATVRAKRLPKLKNPPPVCRDDYCTCRGGERYVIAHTTKAGHKVRAHCAKSRGHGPATVKERADIRREASAAKKAKKAADKAAGVKVLSWYVRYIGELWRREGGTYKSAIVRGAGIWSQAKSLGLAGKAAYDWSVRNE